MVLISPDSRIPNIGFHALRIPYINLAFWDVFGTIIVSILISKYLKLKFIYVIIIVFIIGEIFHIIFHINTQFLKYIKINKI